MQQFESDCSSGACPLTPSREEEEDMPCEIHGHLLRDKAKGVSGSGQTSPRPPMVSSEKLCQSIKGMLHAQRGQLIRHIDSVMADQSRMLDQYLLHQQQKSFIGIPSKRQRKLTPDSPSPPTFANEDSFKSQSQSPLSVVMAKDDAGWDLFKTSTLPPVTEDSEQMVADPDLKTRGSKNDAKLSMKPENSNQDVTPPTRNRSSLTSQIGVRSSQLDKYLPSRRKPASSPFPKKFMQRGATKNTIEEKDKERRKTAMEHVDNMTSSVSKQGSMHKSVGNYLMKTILSSDRFEALIFILILLNVIAIGIEVDYVAQSGVEKSPIEFFIVDTIFTTIFTMELVLRMIAEGRKFWATSDDLAWNLFDLFVVVISVLDMLVNIISISDIGQIRIVRILRVARLLRTMRLIRLVRFLRPLRTLIHSIVATLKSLIWAIFLLALIFYGFAIFFTQAVTHYYIDLESGVSVLSRSTDLSEFWGSLGRSMFTLFKSIAGGISWHLVVTPLARAGWATVAVYNMFMIFAFFAVLNVITGVFCQSAIEEAYHDKEIRTMQMMAHRKEYVETLMAVFREIDADNSGAINIQEFENYLTHEKCQAYLQSLGIDPQDTWCLFKLLDADEEGRIDIKEFVNGCLNLRGNAKAIHIAKMENENKIFRNTLEEFMATVEEQLHAIRNPISSAAGPPSGMSNSCVISDVASIPLVTSSGRTSRTRST